MKSRKKKHIILDRMKKNLKFFWNMNKYRKTNLMNSTRDIFSSHDTFMRKLEGKL